AWVRDPRRRPVALDRRDDRADRCGERRRPRRAGGGVLAARAALGRRNRARRGPVRGRARGDRSARRSARVIRVAVAGAAGRMGGTACGAVDGADDMGLVARADPALGVPLSEALASGQPDVLVDFTVPTSALANAREAVAAGVHVVIGTTGFDIDELRGLSGANVFVAPNFAIGAVLMMQFAAEASKH